MGIFGEDQTEWSMCSSGGGPAGDLSGEPQHQSFCPLDGPTCSLAVSSAMAAGLLGATWWRCRQVWRRAEERGRQLAPDGGLRLTSGLLFRDPSLNKEYCRTLARSESAWRDLCDWGLVALLIIIQLKVSTVMSPRVASACYNEKQRTRLVALMAMLMKMIWMGIRQLHDIRLYWALNFVRNLAGWCLIISIYSVPGIPCISAHAREKTCAHRSLFLISFLTIIAYTSPVGGRLSILTLVLQCLGTLYTSYLLDAEEHSPALDPCRPHTYHSVAMMAVLCASFLLNYQWNFKLLLRYLAQLPGHGHVQ